MGCSFKEKHNSIFIKCQTQHSNFPWASAIQVNCSVDPIKIMKYLGNIIRGHGWEMVSLHLIEFDSSFAKSLSQSEVYSILSLK